MHSGKTCALALSFTRSRVRTFVGPLLMASPVNLRRETTTHACVEHITQANASNSISTAPVHRYAYQWLSLLPRGPNLDTATEPRSDTPAFALRLWVRSTANKANNTNVDSNNICFVTLAYRVIRSLHRATAGDICMWVRTMKRSSRTHAQPCLEIIFTNSRTMAAAACFRLCALKSVLPGHLQRP
jgi:hypothetical protein